MTIPFRDESTFAGGQLFGVLLATVILLLAFWIAARYARGKGWLSRWVDPVLASSDRAYEIKVMGSRRLSVQTMVYAVDTGGRRYLIVESKANASITLMETGTEEGIDEASV